MHITMRNGSQYDRHSVRDEMMTSSIQVFNLRKILKLFTLLVNKLIFLKVFSLSKISSDKSISVNIGTTNIERKTSSGIKGVSLNILSLYSQICSTPMEKNIREEGNLAKCKSLLFTLNYSDDNSLAFLARKGPPGSTQDTNKGGTHAT